MPAEKIQTESRNPTDNPVDRPYLRVAWGHDNGYIQVAALFEPLHGSDVIIRTVNEWLTAAGLDKIPGREELSKLIEQKAGPDEIQFGVAFDGFHVSLDDRRDINRLIAVARRARDSAFGRDE